MRLLLSLARWIDVLNERIGKSAIWLILIVTLIGAGNAVVRKVFDLSSNAMLEIQWYLFSAVFLLCSAYALQKNAHVRIDIITGRLNRCAQAWIDMFGTVFFLMPITVLVIWLSSGVFLESFRSAELSASAGGLILWPARLLVPVGFTLLMLQGFSELIKRIGFLRGLAPDPLGREEGPSSEEQLADEIRRVRGLDKGDAA